MPAILLEEPNEEFEATLYCQHCGRELNQRFDDTSKEVEPQTCAACMPVETPLGWFPMKDAPKDKPIVGWCSHAAAPMLEGEDKLTLYAAHCEGMSAATDGPNVLVWGGGWSEQDYPGGPVHELADWWFVHGSMWECAAYPLFWSPIPDGPAA